MPDYKNPPEPISNLQSLLSFLREMFEKFFYFLNALWDRCGNLGQTNYEFGCRLMAQGDLTDAAFRFKLATWINPRHTQAWYHLGQCELARGKREEAVKAFRKAHALNHSHEETRYMLTLLDPASVMNEPQPTTMPLSLVMLQFDALARGYSQRQEKQGYRGHIQLSEAIFAALPPETKDLVVLDLGCGSGLAGPVLKPRARHLTGVDASRGMLREADRLMDDESRLIYDMLVYMDIREFVTQPVTVPYNIIMAANVLGYVGDITGVFAGIHNVLAPEGVFGFSTLVTDKPGFHVVPGLGRFAHSLGYLREQAARHGWQEISCEEVNFSPKEKAVQLVFKKP